MTTPSANGPVPATSPAGDRPAIDLSRYRVLVTGDFQRPSKELAALAGMGVTVHVVAQASGRALAQLQRLPVDETIVAASDDALLVEAFRWASAANLVVLAGTKAGLLERALLPALQESAAASLDEVIPLVRLDDPGLRYLRTAKRWGYFLVGRALGLPPETARAYMEDCCGYEKQNQDRH